MSLGLLDLNIIGHLGKDPELSTSQSGMKITRFSVACNRKRKGEDKTTWINVVAFDKTAEIASQYLRKGQLVFVKGELDVSKYQRQDGTEGTNVGLLANQIIFLEKKKDAVEQYGDRNTSTGGGDSGITDDDIPF